MSDATIRLDLPAAHRYLSLLSACIGDLLGKVPRLAEPDVTIYNVQLAAQEICANIVDHAYVRDDGRITAEITLQDAPKRLVIDLYDQGVPFEPEVIAVPDLDQVQVRGYGLFLAQALLDELRYEPRAGGNHWRLLKNLSA